MATASARRPTISGSTGRGGKGIRATDVSKAAEIGQLVATFPVGNEDQIMLVSDGGQVIRVPVNGIRIASRATKGVTIFNTAEGEKVVSVERISEPQGDDGEAIAAVDPAPTDRQPANEDVRHMKNAAAKAAFFASWLMPVQDPSIGPNGVKWFLLRSKRKRSAS